MLSASRLGQVVASGRYRLQQQIGRGSFGDVYLAEQLAGGAPRSGAPPAVVKILHPQWAQVEQVVERFRRESQITTKLEHPHVARVFEFGQLDDGVPFIAMEYLPGRSLRDAMQAGTFARTQPHHAFAVLAPVCEALAAAHRAGVVHRDLKPENIQLVSRDSNPEYPVVLDFGVAKFLDAAEKLTMTGAVLGTPAYMPPEQYRGEMNLGPHADVYALGVLTFEVCTGQPPFTGRNFAELAVAHTTQAAPPLVGVPPDIAKVVARCLEKDPARRPTADVLARALRTAVGSAGEATLVSSDRGAVDLQATLRGQQNTLLSADAMATIINQAPARRDPSDVQVMPPLPYSPPQEQEQGRQRQMWVGVLAFLATVCLLGAGLLALQLLGR